MSFPILYLGISAIWFDIPASQCLKILISPFYFLLSALAVLAGYGLWEMKRWAWYVLIFVQLALVYSNAFLVVNFGESEHKLPAYLLSIAVLFVLTYWVGKEVRVPYFLPRIRWWESNPRYKLQVSAKIHRREGEPIDGEIMDLSTGGCFVKIRSELKDHEEVRIAFQVFGLEIESTGHIVWRSQSSVTHPKGIGIKFDAIDRPFRKRLKLVTQRLRKIATFYRTSRYLISPEEFMRRYEELQSVDLSKYRE